MLWARAAFDAVRDAFDAFRGCCVRGLRSICNSAGVKRSACRPAAAAQTPTTNNTKKNQLNARRGDERVVLLLFSFGAR